MSLVFNNIQHQIRFDALRLTGWYDPLTRDENFICDLLVYYGKTEKDDKVFEYMLKVIPITNNVFRCLHKLTEDQSLDNHRIIFECFDRLTKSRTVELFELLKIQM